VIRLDFEGLYLKITSNPKNPLSTFNYLRDRAAYWIGLFETIVVSQSGCIDANGLGLLTYFLDEDGNVW
jgi:hypothetical protein